MSDLKAIKDQGVKIAIVGKERVLKFNLNAFAIIEEEYGSIEAMLGVFDNFKTKDLIRLISIGLAHGENELTAAEIGTITFKEAISKLQNALEEALPAAEKASEDKAKDNVPKIVNKPNSPSPA